MSVTAFLCALAFGLCGDTRGVNAEKTNQQTQQNLAGQTAQLPTAMVGPITNYLRNNVWVTGELPIADILANMTNPGETLQVDRGIRVAIDRKVTHAPQLANSGYDRSRITVWWDNGAGYDPVTGAYHVANGIDDMRRKGFGPGDVVAAMLRHYRSGTTTNTYAIGFARQDATGTQRLVEQHTAETFRLPNDVMTVPVSNDSLGISWRPGGLKGCGILPAATDPYRTNPGTATPTQRWHRDAWPVTTACVPAGYRYIPVGTFQGVPMWAAVAIFNKTKTVRGCNVVDEVTPTYGQLDDPVAFRGLLRPSALIPTYSPINAPATNPSTYLTSDCATDGVPPTVTNPPPTIWTETYQGTCPAGWSGSITYARQGTQVWIVDSTGVRPPPSYTNWAETANNCTPPPPPPPPPPPSNPGGGSGGGGDPGGGGGCQPGGTCQYLCTWSNRMQTVMIMVTWEQMMGNTSMLCPASPEDPTPPPPPVSPPVTPPAVDPVDPCANGACDPVIPPIVDPCPECSETPPPPPPKPCIPGLDAACTTAGVTPPAPPKTWYEVYKYAGGGQNSEGQWRVREVDEATVIARTAMGYGSSYSNTPDGFLTAGSNGYTPPGGATGGDNSGSPDPSSGGDGGNGGGGVGGGGGDNGGGGGL